MRVQFKLFFKLRTAEKLILMYFLNFNLFPYYSITHTLFILHLSVIKQTVYIASIATHRTTALATMGQHYYLTVNTTQ